MSSLLFEMNQSQKLNVTHDFLQGNSVKGNLKSFNSALILPGSVLKAHITNLIEVAPAFVSNRLDVLGMSLS